MSTYRLGDPYPDDGWRNPPPRNIARETLMEWTRSPGFAAMHNGGAADEAIVADLLVFLQAWGFEITRIEEEDPIEP